MKYNLTAREILDTLGYREPVGKEKLEAFEQANQLKLPEAYRTFMEVAHQCPMLETADVWRRVDDLLWYYDVLKEQIEDYREEWSEDPESCQEDELYQLSQLPEEAWRDRVANVLEIGSDCGAGIVSFGVSPETMAEQDPPLLMHHEMDPCTVWGPLGEEGETVSDYLLDVVLNALALIDYETAEEALEALDWEYTELSLEEPFEACLQAAGIDLEQVKRYGRGNYDGIQLFCCYDEEREILYVGSIRSIDEENESILYQIAKG